MNQREILTERLEAIVTACRSLVKRLKRLRASPLLVAQAVNLSIDCTRLAKRTDYLLPTYRRYADDMDFRFERLIQSVADRYPDLGYDFPPTDQLAEPTREITRTVRVSITLPAERWRLIDYYIRSGHEQSYAGYFRRLADMYASRSDDHARNL